MAPLTFAYITLFLGFITFLFGLAQFNKSKLAKPLHKVFGYLTITLILVVYVFMVYKLFAEEHHLVDLLAWHAVIGIILLPIIVAKWLVARPFRGMLKLAPALGLIIFVLLFATINFGGLHEHQKNIVDYTATDYIEGNRLIKVKCTRCHNLDRVNKVEKTLAEWEKTVERMRGKEPGWISDEEAADIINVLIKTKSSNKTERF
jgi:cobalamin biosynthesis protein CobD/CbiB